jgi:lysophospholipase L1-like esterase
MQAPRIIARTGWTTNELDAAIDEAEPAGPFAIVSLLIGVNDQYRRRTTESYQPAFEALLERAVEFAGGEPARVVVLSIPDWGVTPFGVDSGRIGISNEIDAFNAVNRAATLARGARYVDVTRASRFGAEDPALTADDGLHPSGRAYAVWACLAEAAALSALSLAEL